MLFILKPLMEMNSTIQFVLFIKKCVPFIPVCCNQILDKGSSVFTRIPSCHQNIYSNYMIIQSGRHDSFLEEVVCGFRINVPLCLHNLKQLSL